MSVSVWVLEWPTLQISKRQKQVLGAVEVVLVVRVAAGAGLVLGEAVLAAVVVDVVLLVHRQRRPSLAVGGRLPAGAPRLLLLQLHLLLSAWTHRDTHDRMMLVRLIEANWAILWSFPRNLHSKLVNSEIVAAVYFGLYFEFFSLYY